MRELPSVLLIACVRQRCGRCPSCDRVSSQAHIRYQRHPADLPSLGSQVRLMLEVRRFYCLNTTCVRRTFAERVPELLEPWARRTRRMASAQARVGAALGGQAGPRLLFHLGMPARGATLLRLVRRLSLLTLQPPQVVGVDDWALRRGQTYGTIIVCQRRLNIEPPGVRRKSWTTWR